MKLFIIQDRETGNKIDWFDTKAQALDELAVYELNDKSENSYTENFYKIKVNYNKVVKDVSLLLDTQKKELEEKVFTKEDAENIIFSEDDLLEQYLRDYDISEDDVDLESLRDLQHDLLNSLELVFVLNSWSEYDNSACYVPSFGIVLNDNTHGSIYIPKDIAIKAVENNDFDSAMEYSKIYPKSEFL